MKKNKYANANNDNEDNEGGGNRMESLSLTGSGGTFGYNPDPGVSEYKQSTGPNTIPVKFKEAQPVSRAPANLVMDANGEASGQKAQVPTTSKTNKTKNNYNSAASGKGRLGHY